MEHTRSLRSTSSHILYANRGYIRCGSTLGFTVEESEIGVRFDDIGCKVVERRKCRVESEIGISEE